jgi:hypothetical protein
MSDLTLYRGEAVTFTLTLEEDGAPLNITGAEIKFVVRPSIPLSSVITDLDALIVKTELDGITITDGAGGVAEVAIDAADTNELAPGVYVYGVEVIPAGETDPKVFAPAYFTISGDVVRSL